MQLSIEDSRELLAKFGVYAKEVCDRCGLILGPVWFTRINESGVWCSRVCRDGEERVASGTCATCGAGFAGLRRGTRFCSDTCRKREHRKSETTQISRDGARKTKDLETRFKPLAISTLSAPQIAPNA